MMKALEVLTKLVVGTSRFGDHLLKKKTSGILVAALAFLCGAALVYALRREPTATPATSTDAADAAPHARTTFEPACYDEEGRDTAGLEEWKNQHNGTTLRLDYDLVSCRAELSGAGVVMLPSGGSLTGAGDILYMLDAGGRVVWKHTASEVIEDFVHVAATGTVYATTGANSMIILDASTGGRLLLASGGDRGGYRQVLPYGEDACLVVEDRGDNRTDCHGGHRPTQDGVSAWRGTRILWYAAVPADAELQVVGSKIYAVTRTKSRILVREIKVPRGQP
ncbi:MAG: hypothetical protein ABW208_05020 [Pyrinomonadaceae bacterium]